MRAEDFRSLFWTWSVIESADDGCWVATVAELPDFFAAGDTEVEAWANGREALLSHLRSYINTGTPIPAPPARFNAAARSTSAVGSKVFCFA
jgi:predicted RNase H-like HicB family nuclease